MVTFNTQMYGESADRNQRQALANQQNIGQVLQYLSGREDLQAAKLDKERQLAAKQAMQPQNIYATAQQGGQLTPEQQAIYEFNRQKSQRTFIDPNTWQTVTSGGMPSLNGQPMPRAQQPTQRHAQQQEAPTQGEDYQYIMDTKKGRALEDQKRLVEKFAKREALALYEKELPNTIAQAEGDIIN